MKHAKSTGVKSYAKINVSLCIRSKREDGYHELDSIMVPIELHDSMIFTPLPLPDNFVTVDEFSNGLIHYNLVSSAIDMLQKKYNFKQHFRVYIHKIIPMQAGLGGGSSNAAFTFKAVNSILGLNATNEELIKMATTLGADVPFFINCEPARCGGIGEIMRPITVKNNYHVLIIKPKEGCSTKEIFALCDKKPYKQVDMDKVEEALVTGDDEMLAEYMGNSLEEAAISLVPEIQEIKDYLHEKGQKLVLMSGSGSTVYALNTDRSSLVKIYKDIEKNKEDWFSELSKVIK